MALVFWDRKVIGEIAGAAFVKHVRKSKHLLRQPPAWAVDALAYDHLIKGKVKEIRVVDDEEGHTYTAPAEVFEKYKRRFDRGFDPQYFLTLRFWSMDGQPAPASKKIGEDAQASLF